MHTPIPLDTASQKGYFTGQEGTTRSVIRIKFMRRSQIFITLGIVLLLCGCRHKEKTEPLAFYLSKPAPTGASVEAEKKPSLVVSKLDMVAPDQGQRKVTIKLLDSDAAAFEKLTSRNIGKTLILVQGGNVLADATVSQAIPVTAGIMVSVNTNIDFENACLNLLKLSAPKPERKHRTD